MILKEYDIDPDIARRIEEKSKKDELAHLDKRGGK